MPTSELYQAAVEAAKAAAAMYQTYAVLLGLAAALLILIGWKLLQQCKGKDFWDTDLTHIGYFLCFAGAIVLIIAALYCIREATFIQQSPQGWVMKKWCNAVF